MAIAFDNCASNPKYFTIQGSITPLTNNAWLYTSCYGYNSTLAHPTIDSPWTLDGSNGNSFSGGTEFATIASAHVGPISPASATQFTWRNLPLVGAPFQYVYACSLRPNGTIAYDTFAQGNSGSGSLTIGVTPGTLTNGIAIVSVGCIGGGSGGTAISTIKLNGVSMTQLKADLTPGGNGAYYIYYLKNPSAGAQNLVIACNQSCAVEATITTFQGVDQTTPFDGVSVVESNGNLPINKATPVAPISYDMTIGPISNGILEVTILGKNSVGTPGAPTSVTYQGVAMTSMASTTNSTIRLDRWMLYNPPQGFGQVIITYSTYPTGNVESDAISLSGVDPTTQEEAAHASTGNNTNPSDAVTVATANAWVLNMFGIVNTNFDFWNPTSPLIARDTFSQNGDTPLTGIGTNGPHATGSVTSTWSGGFGDGLWCSQSVSLKPAAVPRKSSATTIIGQAVKRAANY